MDAAFAEDYHIQDLWHADLHFHSAWHGNGLESSELDELAPGEARFPWLLDLRTGYVFDVEHVGSEISKEDLVEHSAEVRQAKLRELRN